MALSVRHDINAINTVSVGAVDRSIVHLREVFKPVFLSNSAAFLVAHNHPSGDPSPSMEDRTLTETLAKAGELLGVELLDHIIVGDGETFSFREAGILSEK